MTAAYQLTASATEVLRTSDGAIVPIASNVYQAWLAAGNTPDPYVAPASTYLAALAAKVAALLAAGYQPPGLSTVTKALAIDAAAENQIAAQGAAANIAILKAGSGAVSTTYALPCLDGSIATASAADCAAAAEAVRLYVEAIDVNAAALAASIAGATTPSSVDLTQGWPASG
jgi:hypothetical protein